MLHCGRIQSMLWFSVQLLVPVWRFITSVEQPDVFTVLVTTPRNCVRMWNRSDVKYSKQRAISMKKGLLVFAIAYEPGLSQRALLRDLKPWYCRHVSVDEFAPADHLW